MTGLGLGNRAGGHRAGNNGSVRLRAGVAVLACASVLVLSACDLRLETDPVTFPSPDAATAARNSLADAEAGVLSAAAAAGASADEVAVGAAATAQAHLDALGGVYVAYPDTAPSPSPSSSPAPTLAEAIDTVRATAESVAASTDDANLAFLARSIDLDWALRELWASRFAANAAAEALALASASPTPEGTATDGATPQPTDVQPADPEPILLPGDHGEALFPLAGRTTAAATGFVPASAETGIGQEQLSALALAEDEARFAYETIAALEFGPLRDEVLARSRLHGERSDAFAALLMSDSATPDPRTPLYQLRDVNLPDPLAREALERSIEIDLGVRYAAMLDGASTADAAWLLNAAFDSYARAMATAGFTTADLPTLPGLRVAANVTASAAPSTTVTPTPTPAPAPTPTS